MDVRLRSETGHHLLPPSNTPRSDPFRRPIIYLPNKGLIGKQARADVFDTIERFNNAMQRHSTLGLVSPVQFEKLAAN